MAINVSYQNGKEYSPDMDVALNKTIVGENIIVGNTSFLVSQNTTANMGVKVSVGKAWINGYFINSTASVSLSITGNTSGYSRIDAVVVEASANVGAIKVIQGTPTSNPTCPAIGNTQIKIAEITVVNNAISIGEANIKDCRAKIIESLSKEILSTKEDVKPLIEKNSKVEIYKTGAEGYRVDGDGFIYQWKAQNISSSNGIVDIRLSLPKAFVYPTSVSPTVWLLASDWQTTNDHLAAGGYLKTFMLDSSTVRVIASGLTPGLSYWLRVQCQGF